MGNSLLGSGSGLLAYLFKNLRLTAVILSSSQATPI
jgi:hypothetical protein